MPLNFKNISINKYEAFRIYSFSRSQRKQRKFRHTFRGTLKHDPGASLGRFSNKVEKRPDTVYHITKKDLEPRYARMQFHKPVQINIASADHAVPSTYPVISRKEKGTWLSPDEKILGIPVQEEQNRGKQNSNKHIRRKTYNA